MFTDAAALHPVLVHIDDFICGRDIDAAEVPPQPLMSHEVIRSSKTMLAACAATKKSKNCLVRMRPDHVPPQQKNEALCLPASHCKDKTLEGINS